MFLNKFQYLSDFISDNSPPIDDDIDDEVSDYEDGEDGSIYEPSSRGSDEDTDDSPDSSEEMQSPHEVRYIL